MNTQASPNPFLKRSLNNDKRVILMNLAGRTFLDADKRKTEREARETFLDGFVKDARDIPAGELAVLRKYGKTCVVEAVDLPYRLRVKTGTRTIEVSEEKSVERDDYEELHYLAPAGDLGFVRWNDSAYSGYGVKQTIKAMTAPRHDHLTPLPAVVELPGGGNTVNTVPCFSWDNAKGWIAFISDDTHRKLDAYYIAMRDRAAAEQALLLAMFKFIANAKTYGDVLEFWPEAAALENDLFGERPVVNTALVALNNDDRALLCNHMSRRGIASTICQAATSPAYAEAAG